MKGIPMPPGPPSAGSPGAPLRFAPTHRHPSASPPFDRKRLCGPDHPAPERPPPGPAVRPKDFVPPRSRRPPLSHSTQSVPQPPPPFRFALVNRRPERKPITFRRPTAPDVSLALRLRPRSDDPPRPGPCFMLQKGAAQPHRQGPRRGIEMPPRGPGGMWVVDLRPPATEGLCVGCRWVASWWPLSWYFPLSIIPGVATWGASHRREGGGLGDGQVGNDSKRVGRAKGSPQPAGPLPTSPPARC